MSRRRETPDEYHLKVEREWATFRIVCTGRGTHGMAWLGEARMHREDMATFTPEQVPGLSDEDVRDLVLIEADEGPVPVLDRRDDRSPRGAGHITQTFRCGRCGRNVPLRDAKMQRKFLVLLLAGVSRVDLSSLDRVRLT